MRWLLSFAFSLLLCAAAFGQTGDFAPTQTASNPLQLRIADGKVGGGILGTYQLIATNVLLTASSTNFIFLDLSQSPPVLTVNTTGFPTSQVYKIATAVTSTSQITSLADNRPALNLNLPGGGGITQAFLNGTVIDATTASYGLKYNTFWTVSATFNGTSTVQSDANSPCFVSASDPGKKTEGTTFNGNDQNYPSTTLAFAETTIASVTDCHHAVLTAGTPGACSAACLLAWGTQDDTGAAAVWAAATAVGSCKSIQWPDGGIWLDNPQFNTNAGNCNVPVTGPTRVGLQFSGQGGHEGGTIFFIGQGFTGASCPASACFFTPTVIQGIKLTSFGMFGGGVPNIASITAAALLNPGIDDEVDDVELAGISGGSGSTLICINLNNVDVRWLIVDGCGATNGTGQNHVGMHQSFFGQGPTNNFVCNSSGGFHIESHGTGYALANNSNGEIGILLNSGCNWVTQGDVFVQNTPTNSVALKALTGSTADLTGMTADLHGGTTTTGLWANGGTIVVRSSQIGGSTQAVLANNTTGLYIDETPGATIYAGGAVNATSPACVTGDSGLINCANLTAQAANISATTLFTSPATARWNVYTLYYDVLVTTIGTGTVTVNLICPNGTATVTQAGAATLSMTANNEASGAILCHAATSSAIQYSTTGFSTGAYSLNLRLVAK